MATRNVVVISKEPQGQFRNCLKWTASIFNQKTLNRSAEGTSEGERREEVGAVEWKSHELTLPGRLPGLCLCISGQSCTAGRNYVLFGAGSSVWAKPGVHSQLETKTCVPWDCGKQTH